MKKRYCCQIAVAVIIILFLAYHMIGAQSFSALQVSYLESQVSEGEVITLSGTIYKKLRKKEGFDFYLKQDDKTEVVYVSLNDSSISEILKTGQSVQVTGKVHLFNETPNPGNFNQKFYYQKQNIYVKLQNASVDVLAASQSIAGKVREALWEIQQLLTETIILYAGENYGGILSAMVLGEDVYVDPEIKEIMQKSGIAHLLAISGLHVSFIGTGMYKMLRKMRAGIRISAIFSSTILTFYILMIGSSVSTLRAWIMFLLQMGANITGREYDGKTALALSALVLLGMEPVNLFDAGFLLSFGAVLGIYVIAPALNINVSAAIQCILIPVQLYYYYEICLYAMLWNFIAIPVSAVALGSTIVGLILAGCPVVPISLIQGWFYVGKWMIAFYEMGSNFVLELPFSMMIMGQPTYVWMLAYYLMLLCCILCKKKKGLLVLVLMGGILFINNPREDLEITMLNVGQGDCFLIQNPEGGTYLIDGGSSSVQSVGQYRIEPYLKMEGIQTLDYVWITHGDADHMNGILELLQREHIGIKIKNLILPPEEYWNENIYELIDVTKKDGTNVHTMRKGQQLQEGDLQIICLWPSETEGEVDINQASIVLSLHYDSFDMLFTGDLEKGAEEAVTEYIEKLQEMKSLPEKYEVLKVGHHGSRYSTSKRFLEIVRPEVAFISAGEKNLYGHPHEETLERLAKCGSVVFSTKDGKAVKITVEENQYKIE